MEAIDIVSDLISGDLHVGRRNEMGQAASLLSTQSAIIRALLSSFIFDVCRLYRIIEHAHQGLGLEKNAKRSFLASTKSLVDYRGQIEHGEDPSSDQDSFPKNIMIGNETDGFMFMTTPSFHWGPSDQIWFGDINLVMVRGRIQSVKTDLLGQTSAK